MKKFILIIIFATTILSANAQDTIHTTVPIEKDGTLTMWGIEVGVPLMGRGLINPNITIPQRIASEYHIIHYIAAGYSFLEDKKDEYLFSYGIGIPLRVSKKGGLYMYFIDAYHYRPDGNEIDPTKNRDFRQRRIRMAYRTNNLELSTTYTLRYSAILGISYSFNSISKKPLKQK